jgi:secreted Zn-dependent insulinase-like peptidase
MNRKHCKHCKHRKHSKHRKHRRYSKHCMFNHFSIQAALLDKILNHISNFSPDPERFEILKEQYVRGLKNFTMEQPHQHAVYYNQVNTYPNPTLLNLTPSITTR